MWYIIFKFCITSYSTYNHRKIVIGKHKKKKKINGQLKVSKLKKQLEG